MVGKATGETVTVTVYPDQKFKRPPPPSWGLYPYGRAGPPTSDECESAVAELQIALTDGAIAYGSYRRYLLDLGCSPGIPMPAVPRGRVGNLDPAQTSSIKGGDQPPAFGPSSTPGGDRTAGNASGPTSDRGGRDPSPELAGSMTMAGLVLACTYFLGRRAQAPDTAPAAPCDPTEEREETDGESSPDPPPLEGSCTDAETQTVRACPPPFPPSDPLSEVWVSGAGKRFHLRERCCGLNNAQQVFCRTRCGICG